MTLVATCLLALLVGGEHAKPPVRCASPEQRVDLAGKWILTMPNGEQCNATFVKECRCGHIRLRLPGMALQGEYDLAGNRLAMARPDDEKMSGLAWKVRNPNVLELVEHPATSRFGPDYRGAILVRRIKEDATAAQLNSGQFNASLGPVERRD